MVVKMALKKAETMVVLTAASMAAMKVVLMAEPMAVN